MKKSVFQLDLIPSSLPSCEYNPPLPAHVYCPFLGILLDQHNSVFSQVPSLPLG